MTHVAGSLASLCYSMFALTSDRLCAEELGVLTLERDQLTSGTTWHAAGLMTTFGSTSETSVQMRTYTRDLYGRLEAETDQATGFEPLGFIELAADDDRLEEYRRVAAFNRLCGNEVEEISPAEIKKRFPLCRVDDLKAGFYLPKDGRVNPVDATMALAKGARLRGVRIVQGVSATGVSSQNGRVTGVNTDQGTITCEFVVNCAGMWARQFGALAGVSIPNQSTEHYYLIAEPIEGIRRDLPIIEDPSSHGYYREEMGGLMIGLFEPVCAPWAVDGIPPDFSSGEIQPDWERMTPFLEKAMSRVPITAEAGIKKFFCGPESFTPDMGPAFGEAPELENYFVAAGLNSIGIITGGGMGYELCIPAEQAVHVYDRVVAAGAPFGLRHAGLKALGSLRMEKAYRDYGHDIDNTDDPFDVGLGFAVDLDKPDFIGRGPCVEKKAQGPAYHRRLLQILCKDPEPLLYHAEIVYRNGAPVGYNRVGSYGFTLGGAVGLAMIEAGEPVNRAYLKQGDWQVEVAGKRYPAEVCLPARPLYDPKLKRVKA